MSIIYFEPRAYSFFEIELPNGKYRYEGRHANINYCIDSQSRKTEEEIENYLERCSVDFLIDREGSIITLREV